MKINRNNILVNYPGDIINKKAPISTLYHYTNIHSFIKIWHNKSLRFSEITNMNDIVENNYSACTHELNFNALELYIKKRKCYKQISLSLDFDTYYLGSMSTAMWGHYGDNGNGVCIEINYKKLKLNNNIIGGRINYKNELSCPNFINQINEENVYAVIEKHASKVFFEKNLCWQYENEYRLISRIDDFLNIKDAVSGIYLTKCNSAESDVVLKLLENEDINIWQVHMSNPIKDDNMIMVSEDLRQNRLIQDFNKKQII